MKPLIIFFGLTLSLQAMANSCLSSATNSELLSEVQRRMSSGGGGGNTGIMVSVACSGNFLNVRTLKVSTGEVKTVASEHLGGDCNTFASSLNSVTDVELIRSIIISVCSSNFLNKIMINTQGEARTISSDHMGSSCKEKAMEQNRRLVP